MKENILKGCAMHLSFTPRGFANDEKTTLSDQSFMSIRGLCLRISKAFVCKLPSRPHFAVIYHEIL